MSYEADTVQFQPSEHEPKQLDQLFNPEQPDDSQRPVPSDPSGKPDRVAPDQIRLKRGHLDSITAQLIRWVAGGCDDAGWNALLEQGEECQAPPWLRQAFVRLDDLSHRILAISLAHLVHQQGVLEESPFSGALNGECLLRHLSLPALGGICELSKRLAPTAPLRSRHWLEVDQEWSIRRSRKASATVSVNQFLNSEISLSISLLGSLLGLSEADDDKPGPGLDELILPSAVRTAVERLLENPPSTDSVCWIYIKGPARSGRRSLAKAIAAAMGQSLKTVRPDDVAHPASFLLADVNVNDWQEYPCVSQHASWVFLRGEGGDSSGQLNLDLLANIVLDLGALEPEARLAQWTKCLNEAGLRFSSCDPTEFARHEAAPGVVIDLLRRLAQEAEQEDLTPEVTKARLEAELKPCGNDANEIDVSDPIELIAPKRTIDELCLNPDASSKFRRILASIRGRAAMLNQWKLDPGLVGRAQGVALFHGPSGTGKSMAAEVLAHELGLPLCRIEATQLESAYVGESESRLHDFFARAQKTPAVLLLDEADSFLVDRSRTEGSTKRYQNSLVNQWLRELEHFEGILVLTTNHASGMDSAVERRIQFRMAFENPNAEVRQRIWQTLFQNAPIPGREDLNLAVIADRYSIAGGRIRNAFLDACQQAAQVGSISQAILREACEVEMRSSLPTLGTRAIRGFAGYAV